MAWVMQFILFRIRERGFLKSLFQTYVYAAAVIKAAQQAGLRVPQDIAIVGFDNVEISAMCNPSITTINQLRFQMGFLSCEMLVNRILGNDIPIQNLYLEI